MIKTLGYILFVLCCLAWLLIAVIPFLGYSKGATAGIITGLIIFGEVTFYVSILMLGKTFYNKIREKFRFRRKRAEAADSLGHTITEKFNPVMSEKEKRESPSGDSQ